MNATESFSKSSRICFAMISIGLLGLVTIARFFLSPDPNGLGTHQQLGLPPCTMYQVTGIPCPSCGMTTSWAYAVRGDVSSAMKVNFAGLILLIQGLLSAPVLFWIAYRGKSTRHRWFSRVTVYSLGVVIAISFVQWVLRLAGIQL